MHATVRVATTTNVAAAGKGMPAMLWQGGLMFPYLVLSVSPYPNSALSAGELAIIAVVPVLALAFWLTMVFVAAREPRHRAAGGIASLPERPPAKELQRAEPEHKAA